MRNLQFAFLGCFILGLKSAASFHKFVTIFDRFFVRQYAQKP